MLCAKADAMERWRKMWNNRTRIEMESNWMNCKGAHKSSLTHRLCQSIGKMEIESMGRDWIWYLTLAVSVNGERLVSYCREFEPAKNYNLMKRSSDFHVRDCDSFTSPAFAFGKKYNIWNCKIFFLFIQRRNGCFTFVYQILLPDDSIYIARWWWSIYVCLCVVTTIEFITFSLYLNLMRCQYSLPSTSIVCALRT